MNANIYNKPCFDDFGIQISSVSEYIMLINSINYSNTENSEELFFRGQKTEFWNLEPSIFRNNYLSVEHKLMEIPLLKTPYEFIGINNDFEIMTKYQHYNMCTRLLDLTTNPLVALYFACEEFGKVSYIDESNTIQDKEPYGIIYFNKSYPISANDIKVKIISALTKMDLSKDNKFISILTYLSENHIIPDTKKNAWLDNKNYNDFIDIIQNNYVVSPTYSNERLSRQNGYFFLSGSFSFTQYSPISDSIISKTKQNLRHEFDNNFFYIDGDDKSSILQELDTYNINESTLFPELEHQLNYIKNKNLQNSWESPSFTKFEQNDKASTENIFLHINDNLSKNTNFKTKILDYLNTQYNSNLSEQIWNTIRNTIIIVDWYKQSSILSELRINLKKIGSFS